MKFLGLGDNVIDYYSNTGEMYPGGNAVNTAAHAAILGEEAAYLGNLGEDSMSQVIRDALIKFGVDFSHCATVSGGTTKYCDYQVIDGERQFVKVVLGEHWSGPMVLEPEHLAYMKEFTVIHSCCNAKMENEMWKVGELPAVFTYDFSMKEKYRTEEYLKKICPWLDLGLFSCEPMNAAKARAFCERIHEQGVKHVLITMGSAGQYVSNGTELLKGKIERIEKPVDTMGAGDAFVAALIISMVRQGWKKGESMSASVLRKALKEASSYAGCNCMIEGGFGYKYQSW